MINEKDELCLTKEELEYLDQIIGKLPTSIGIFFVDFFRIVNKRIEDQEAIEKTENHAS